MNYQSANFSNTDKKSLISLLKMFKHLPPEGLNIPRLPTRDECEQLLRINFRWQLIGLKIDYFQKRDFGFILDNPLDTLDIHPWEREVINIISETRYRELQLTIAGWKIIKQTASDSGRKFTFNNPREFFAERCKQEILWTIRFLSYIENNPIGETLEEERKHYRFLNNFYRNRFPESETFSILESYKNSDSWQNFTICAIWKYRLNEKEIKDIWIKFLNVFKKESALICNKDSLKKYGVRLSFLRWYEGKAINTATKQPPNFEYICPNNLLITIF
ncbi:MAG: hypothetical protein KME30_30275 [Iphinoe sp. HA4291-MV1]|jgi:hypothetical protein|nr:hypothetical protein [Iphinoe sp. HA4291-MV1]